MSACSNRILLDPDVSITRLSHGGTLKDEVNRLVEPLIIDEQSAGIMVAVLDENEKVSLFPYGYKNLESRQPMTVDTLFGIGSVTKSMVVSLLLSLDSKGILSVNDTIGDLLPKHFILNDKRISQITFAQLASHTSGLPREPETLDGFISLINYLFTGNNIYSHLTDESVYDFLEEYKLPTNSVENPNYSNIGIGLLGHFLTLKTGKTLESLLKQYVLAPLEMHNTVIALRPEDKLKLATGYAGDQPLFVSRNTPLENWTFSSVMQGTGGVFSTAKDLIKYLKAHLGKSETQLDSALLKSRKIFGKDESHFITMGWYVDYLPKYEKNLYYYHGMISGFNCYIGFEPESNIAVVVLRNNFNWTDVVGHNLLLTLSRYKELKIQKLKLARSSNYQTTSSTLK